MKKFTMKDLVIYTMDAMNETTVLVYSLKCIAQDILTKTKVFLAEEFEATRESILSVVIENRKLFKLSENGRWLAIEDPEYIKKYIAENPIEEDVKNTIKDSIIELNEPFTFSSNEIGEIVEIVQYIKSGPEYITWLFDMLEKYKTFSASQYSIAKTGKDLAHLTMVSTFYNIIEWYCKKNMVPSIERMNKEYYIISYKKGGKNKCLRIGKFENCQPTEYVLWQEDVKISEAIYFPDIAFDVENTDLSLKQEKLGNIEQEVSMAKNIGIPVSEVKSIVEKVYGV